MTGVRRCAAVSACAAALLLALESVERNRPDAMVVPMTGVLLERIVKVVEFAARHRMPALYTLRHPMLSGGLMSCSADFGAMASGLVIPQSVLLRAEEVFE